jgi:LysR family transcriptional regulator, carnitine catabolism transcriptional activator
MARLSVAPSSPVALPSSRNVTIKHLRAFLSVTKHKNFTRASMELHLSQPSLTTAIRQLEDMVGASLFDRTTRTVSLTPEGLEFVPVAERLVYDFDLAIGDIRAAAKRRLGRIGIAVVHSVATKLIPDVLMEFARSNPEIRAQLRDGNSSDVRRRVKRNEVDVGFCSKDEDDAELDFQPLFKDQMGLLMRRGHPLSKTQRALSWTKLDGHDFIGLTQDTATGLLLDQVPHLPRSMTMPRFEVSMNSTLWSLVEAGVGVTTVAALSVSGGAGPHLVFRPLCEPVMWRTVYSVTRRGRAPSAPTLDIIELIRTKVRNLSSSNPLITPSPE